MLYQLKQEFKQVAVLVAAATMAFPLVSPAVNFVPVSAPPPLPSGSDIPRDRVLPSQALGQQRAISSLPSATFADGEVLVKFKPGAATADRRTFRAHHRLEQLAEIPEIGVEQLRVPSGSSVAEMVNALWHDPNVEYAEPNYTGTGAFTPNDMGDKDWGLARIKAPEAWDIPRLSHSVVVAVIDAGVRADHEDLQGKVVGGYNFVENNTDTSDVHGHGTLVAGIVGAQFNNSRGLPGMGPEISLLALRVSNSNNAFNYFDLARAILYAAGCNPNGSSCGAPRASVINLSIGGTSDSLSLQDAVNTAWDKGIVIVAAAGSQGNPQLLYPARYDRVTGVGGTDKNDNRWSGSNTGAGLDVVAPAVSLYTTDRGGGYKTKSGTSGSAPYVAGLAALIRGVNPALSPTEVRAIIRNTADDLGPGGWDPEYGFGRINAAAALEQAAGAEPPTQPTMTLTGSPTVGTGGGSIGGKAFGISTTATGAVLEAWTGGSSQRGYVNLRYDMATGESAFNPPTGLPAGATSFTDSAFPVPGGFYCYLLLPYTDTAVYRSDAICVARNTGSAIGAPQQLRLRLNQTNTARLSWSHPVGGGHTGYRVTPAFGANPPSPRDLPTSQTSVDVPFGGGFMCFLVEAVGRGHADILCGWAGIANIP